MKELCGVVAMATALAFSSPATAASEADCQALWNKTDARNSGYISGKTAAFYMAAMTKSGRTTASVDRIASQEFMVACRADVFRNATT